MKFVKPSLEYLDSYLKVQEALEKEGSMTLNPSAHNMWNKFLKLSTDENLKKNEFQYTCFQFGVAPDELGKLVFDGIKRAGTSLVLAYENEMAEYPKVGAYSIVLNSKDEALCIVKIIKTSIKKFSDVDENYAFLEGEGDKSLSYWQRVHREFFGDYLKKLNKEFSDDMEVFMDEYEVVYK